MVLGGELGIRKTATCIGLVVIMSTAAGMIYRNLVGCETPEAPFYR